MSGQGQRQEQEINQAGGQLASPPAYQKAVAVSPSASPSPSDASLKAQMKGAFQALKEAESDGDVAQVTSMVRRILSSTIGIDESIPEEVANAQIMERLRNAENPRALEMFQLLEKLLLPELSPKRRKKILTKLMENIAKTLGVKVPSSGLCGYSWTCNALTFICVPICLVGITIGALAGAGVFDVDGETAEVETEKDSTGGGESGAGSPSPTDADHPISEQGDWEWDIDVDVPEENREIVRALMSVIESDDYMSSVSFSREQIEQLHQDPFGFLDYLRSGNDPKIGFYADKLAELGYEMMENPDNIDILIETWSPEEVEREWLDINGEEEEDPIPTDDDEEDDGDTYVHVSEDVVANALLYVIETDRSISFGELSDRLERPSEMRAFREDPIEWLSKLEKRLARRSPNSGTRVYFQKLIELGERIKPEWSANEIMQAWSEIKP